MATLNIHIYPSPFTNETRILRITKSLHDKNVFNSILVIASQRDNPNLVEHEELDGCRRVWRVPSKAIANGKTFFRIVSTLEFSIRAFMYMIKEDIACINAHSLSTLPVAVLMKIIKKSKLVYDTHEIETETGQFSLFRRILSKTVEKVLIRFADAVALTSFGHEAWYKDTYDLKNLWVIRNCPYRRQVNTASKGTILRDMLKIGSEELLFIYQGAIAKPRGCEVILRAFARLPKNKHIVFMGFGSDLSFLLEYVSKYPNIHYLPAVPPGQVASYTSCADVGIHMMDNSCLNHLYALPNKPMEYMNAGIPAIVSDVPEMSRLIRDAEAGWVVPVGDCAALEELILSLDSEAIREKSKNALQWATYNYWEKEEDTLFRMYESLGFSVKSTV